MLRFSIKLASFAALAMMVLIVSAEARECKSMGFSVNDYGKEGPARDAQALLDKRIQTEMQAKGIKRYTVGKKTVSCKLFLDLIVFDEYTCTAIANVCWGFGPVTKQEVTPVKSPEAGPAKVQ